jgi:hypothetical protein
VVVQLLVFQKSHSFANKNHCNVIIVLENNYITLLLFCNNVTNILSNFVTYIVFSTCSIIPSKSCWPKKMYSKNTRKKWRTYQNTNVKRTNTLTRTPTLASWTLTWKTGALQRTKSTQKEKQRHEKKLNDLPSQRWSMWTWRKTHVQKIKT